MMIRVTYVIIILVLPLLLFAQNTDSLTAYYRFDGNANDASGNNNHGTVNGPIPAEDRFGRTDHAYSFNGTSDYILVPDSDDLDVTGDFSLGFWLKPTIIGTPASNMTLLNKHQEPEGYDGSWWIALTPDLKVLVEGTPYFYFTGITSQQSVQPNVWNHVFFTYNDSTDEWAIYLNGTQDTTEINQLELQNTTHNLYIGALEHSNPFQLTDFYQGVMDEIRIYRRVLTDIEIQALYNGTAQVALTPSSMPFGEVEVGTDTTDILIIENIGDAELFVDTIRVSGLNADQFTIDTTSCIVAPGDSFFINVSFAPTAVGDFIASLDVKSNAGDTSVVLSGNGIAPELMVTPDLLDFGSVRAGIMKRDSVLIKNIGTVDLTMDSLFLSGPNFSNFIHYTNPTNIAPGDSEFCRVGFIPDTIGTFTALLSILSNGGDAEITLLGNGRAPKVTSVADTLDFGEVCVSRDSTRMLIITNSGNDTLFAYHIELFGQDTADFSFESGEQLFSILPGSTDSLIIHFSPQSAGYKTADLVSFTNMMSSPHTLVLTGIGLPVPIISLNATNLNFGQININADSTRNLLISNIGDTALTFQAEFFGEHAADFSIETGTLLSPILPGATDTVRIHFSPQTAGYKTADFVMFSNAFSSPDTVALTGEGIEFTMQVQPDSTPKAGESVRLTITAPGNFQARTRLLYYRQPGETSWHSIILDSTSTGLNGIIPPDLVTYHGIEYYVYLSDGQNEFTFPPTNPQMQPAALQVAVAQVVAEVALRNTIYRMISVPIALENPDIFTVLMDDYGEYDTKDWRLFRWQQADSAYVEFPGIQATFTPGTSFWLVTREGTPFDVENGWSINSTQLYEYALTPGWNQVSNPFPFPIVVDSIRNVENLERPVYYNGSEYLYDVTVMEPWEGYFVYNPLTTPIIIEIPPVAAPSGLRKISDITQLNSDDEYLLQLSAEMSHTLLIDTQNFIGLLKNSDQGRDKMDISEAPPIGEFLRISIMEQGERFSGNFKPLQNSGQQWDITIGATIAQREINVNLIEYGKLPDGFNLYVLDKDYQCPIKIQDNAFKIILKNVDTERRLKIILGTEEYAQNHREGISLVPIAFSLNQNYPNPFNPATSIEYQVGRRGLVTLEVFNMLGQKIRTLMDEVQSPGLYKTSWNGTNDAGNHVASGIYFCHFKAGDFRAVRKLILMR